MTTAVVVAAGGTGGHLVPALAVADAIRRARPDAVVAFIGTARGLERELVPAAGYRLLTTSMRPFGGGAAGAIAALSLVPATAQALRILRREGARAVLGMGGYPSLPAVAAARLAGIPAVVHEQNAVPGLANAVGARLTRHLAVSFAETLDLFGRRRPRLIGVPLREPVARLDRAALRAEALGSFGLEPHRRTVLAFGGSIGAARVNEAAIGLVERWRHRDDVQVLLVAGARNRDAVAARLSTLAARCVGFVERMELAYAAADVVVCRGGASTVAELAAVGLPAIVVPYPHARRREQDANARALERAGAAVLIDDAALDPERLREALDELLSDPARLEAMGKAGAVLARPRAAGELAAWVLGLAEGSA